jgi:hypothetical protein
MTCNVALGPVTVSGPQVTQCNGTNQPFSHTSQLDLVGQTTTSSIHISSTTLQLNLENISITSPSPFIITSSSVTFSLSGLNQVFSTNSNGSGVECELSSNISLIGFPNSLLRVTGGSQSSGVGSGSGAFCESIEILNGSYSMTGGSGLGSSFGNLSSFSRLKSLKISGGSVNATGYFGAGIGSGEGSQVDNIIILNGFINSTGTRGAGIGSGRANGASSSVGSLTIAGGTIAARGFYSAAIGSGYAFSGTSHVENLTILNGTIRAVGSFGSGIGAGPADGTRATSVSNSSIGALTIVNGRITANGTNGAGIGA